MGTDATSESSGVNRIGFQFCHLSPLSLASLYLCLQLVLTPVVGRDGNVSRATFAFFEKVVGNVAHAVVSHLFPRKMGIFPCTGYKTNSLAWLYK